MSLTSTKTAFRVRGYRRYIVVMAVALLAACSSSNKESDGESGAVADSENVIPETDTLAATIRRTTNGVPHVLADSLEAVAFGHGYAQAQDNVCQLAESIVKARSKRALYFGPGPDNIHIVNDFSYQAMRIYSGAVEELPTLSIESRALLDGFAAGYNQYVTTSSAQSLPHNAKTSLGYGPSVQPICWLIFA